MQNHNSSRLLFASLLLAAACGEVTSKDTDAASAVDATAELVDARVGQLDASIVDATVAMVDATIAQPDATIVEPDASFACVPNSIECANATLTECDSTGQVPVETVCTLGCMGTSRCADLDPSNGLASNLDTAATTFDVVFTGTATIDTSAGTISDGSGALALSTEVITGGPVDVFVIEVKSLTASDINVVGNRALAIVSDGDISISGVLDVSADLNRPGSGALTGNSSCQGGQGGGVETRASGGGGGGFGRPGGRGGVGGVLGGVPGMTSGNAMLEPLRGGCRGGNGGANQLNSSLTDEATDPGAGGGAVQLVSNTRIVLTIGAAIAANGGGRKPWTGQFFSCFLGFPCSPSDGGGSGGAILLEAPLVSISNSATLAANGGSGGCGSTGGENGVIGAIPVPGGDCQTSPAYGNGGVSGAGTSATGGNGFNGSGDSAIGGGGGGGLGRIRVNLPVGSTFSPAGVVSPAATAGALGTR